MIPSDGNAIKNEIIRIENIIESINYTPSTNLLDMIKELTNEMINDEEERIEILGILKKTAEYIDYVLTRCTIVGAIYLAVVCLIPEFLYQNNISFALGGTSILIVVSVTTDTVAQIQSSSDRQPVRRPDQESKVEGGTRR